MKLFVLVAWLIQGAVGVSMLWRRRATPLVILHVLPIAVSLGLWIWFASGGPLVVGWIVFGVFTIALGFGDAMMVQGAKRLLPSGVEGVRKYVGTVGLVFSGKLPRRVVFHALFSPVVYFSALAACILETVR
jgi:hypothetical protein